MTRKNRKSWSKHNLPEELWPEILSRLPAKSLLRFRCVSLSWRALIDDPNFARSHLTSFSNNRLQSHLCVAQGQYFGSECVVRCSNTFRVTARLGTFPPHASSTTGSGVRDWTIGCCVDGIFLLTEQIRMRIKGLMLWNPSIRKARLLPPLPHAPLGESFDLGLGFDESVEDYKAVRVRFVGYSYETLHSIAIYTLRSDSWKIIQFQGKGSSCSEWRWHFYWETQRSVCLNGVVYFTGLTQNSMELVSFELSNEVFASTIMPPVSSAASDVALTLIDGGSSLAAISCLKTHGSVWVLEGSGSWTNRYTFRVSDPELCTSVHDTYGRFLCLTKSGDMFFSCRKAVTSYNVETQVEKAVQKKNVGMIMFTACGYIESLILL